VRGRHLPGERLLDRVASLVVAAEGQDRAPERVLQLGCVGGVRRERGKNEADEACRVLPNLVARQLVHPAEEEPEACGGEDGRWHPLSGRCREGGGEHRDRSDQQEQAQCVARRPRIRGQSYEREREPNAREQPHSGRGCWVAGEKSEEGGDELERDREGDDDQCNLVSF
jgi:hypothetical protein